MDKRILVCFLCLTVYIRLTAFFQDSMGKPAPEKQNHSGKTNLDLLEQEIVSGSGISWAICKSAPRSRQITTPASHHSVFLQAGWPSCRPTNSVKALKAYIHNWLRYQLTDAVNNWKNVSSSHTDMQIADPCQASHGLYNQYTQGLHLITLWPWPFTFWPQGQCMLRACHGKYVNRFRCL